MKSARDTVILIMTLAGDLFDNAQNDDPYIEDYWQLLKISKDIVDGGLVNKSNITKEDLWQVQESSTDEHGGN